MTSTINAHEPLIIVVDTHAAGSNYNNVRLGGCCPIRVVPKPWRTVAKACHNSSSSSPSGCPIGRKANRNANQVIGQAWPAKDASTVRQSYLHEHVEYPAACSLFGASLQLSISQMQDTIVMLCFACYACYEIKKGS